MKAKAETANQITRNIVRILKLQRAYVTRMQSQGQYDEKKRVWRTGTTQKGAPDIVACYKGRFLGVEVKAGKDRQSIHQKITEQDINVAGGVYWIVRSTDEFIRLFDELKKVL